LESTTEPNGDAQATTDTGDEDDNELLIVNWAITPRPGPKKQWRYIDREEARKIAEKEAAEEYLAEILKECYSKAAETPSDLTHFERGAIRDRNPQMRLTDYVGEQSSVLSRG